MDDTAEQMAVARYLQTYSHDHILLRWMSKKPDNPRALGLLHAIGKSRSEPGSAWHRGRPRARAPPAHNSPTQPHTHAQSHRSLVHSPKSCWFTSSFANTQVQDP
jgi:hypothetical protein